MRATPCPAPVSDDRPRRDRRRTALVVVAIAVVLLAAVAGAAVYTERPQFCPTCHEMGPYYDAWASGPHARTSCVECHVDPGPVSHALHKFVALKEVWDHFTRDNRFPTWGVDLPNARCRRCHDTIPTMGGSRFDHKLHADKAACKDCHAQAGHAVPTAALAGIGVLNVGATRPLVAVASPPTSAPGHIEVSCQRCHDQAKMRCSQCHTAPHEARGECSECHRPGTRFAFAHPAAQDCARCHKPPANHFGAACGTCHSPGVPFVKAVFLHQGNTGPHDYRGFPCAKCHPNSYAVAYCSCHGGRPPKGD